MLSAFDIAFPHKCLSKSGFLRPLPPSCNMKPFMLPDHQTSFTFNVAGLHVLPLLPLKSSPFVSRAWLASQGQIWGSTKCRRRSILSPLHTTLSPPCPLLSSVRTDIPAPHYDPPRLARFSSSLVPRLLLRASKPPSRQFARAH